MSVTLQHIESSVPEWALIQAEELLENQQFTSLHKADSNLWVGSIDHHEVEIQLSGTKVVGGTCECHDFLEKGICKHYVALLLVIRKEREKQRQERIKKRRKPKNTQKLTTSVVLDQADHEALVEFVKEYARTNRNFAIALKARFASSVSQIEQEDKYRQLLDSTISAIRKPDRTITTRGAQKLIKVLKELDTQMELAIVEHDLIETVYMARSIIERISPLLGKLNNKYNEVYGFVLKAFQHLGLILKQDPAPSLIRELRTYILSEYSYITYRPHKLDIQFVKLLQQMMQDETAYHELISVINTLEEKYEDEDRPTAPLLLARLETLEQAGKQEEAKEVMEQNLTESEVLYYAIEQAKSIGARPRMKALIETGLKLPFPQKDVARLEELLLNMAEEDDDALQINKLALSRFLDTLDIAYYKKAKRYASPLWDEQIEQVLQQLTKRTYSIRTQQAIGNVYVLEERKQELLQLLEKTGSIKLLLEFSIHLMPDFSKEISVVYRTLLNQYTQQHLGRTAAVRVREIMHNLHTIGASRLANELIEEYRSRYPERHSLIEELSVFL